MINDMASPTCHTSLAVDFATTDCGEVEDDTFTFHIATKTEGRSKGCEKDSRHAGCTAHRWVLAAVQCEQKKPCCD
jgi:hypothetical protein